MDTEQYQQPGTYSIFDEQESPPVSVSTGVRFVNFIIDLVVVLSLGLGLEYALMGPEVIQRQESSFFQASYVYEYLQGWVTNGIIYSIMEGCMGGRSIGKLITRTRAIRRDGAEFTLRDAIGRSFARGIPFNELSILFGEPWHDRLTRTTVVAHKANTPNKHK